ncbi:hypothetical protein ACLMJK_002275 [Lecanora helva]
MVKAPRSKGCRVCVDRRVKCDLRRPFCLRCEKANRQCPGYETINIVDEGPSVRQLYVNVGRDGDPGTPSIGHGVAQGALRKSSMSSTSSTSTSSRSRPDHRAPFEYLGVPVGSTASTSPSRNAEDTSTDIERSTLVAIISPSSYQCQLFSSFIDSISYNRSGVGRLAPADQCHSLWMAAIARRTEISSTLLWSIRAISLSHLGLQMQDRSLIHNSRNMYGRALLKLNKALQDPVEGLSSDTLSATVLLSFYEMMACTERHSWVRHAGGAGNLIRLRGPDRHRDGFGRIIFLSCRYTMILEAYQTRTPCFLALPEWRQLSRELEATSESRCPLTSAREDIFQTAVDVPGYVSASINYMTNGSRDTTNLRNLVSQGHGYRSNYKHLHARFVEILEDAGQAPTMTASVSDDKLFPIVYQFPNNLIGSFYCSNWSFTIMLNVVLIGLEARLAEYTSPDPPSLERQSPTNIQPPQPPHASRAFPMLWQLTETQRRSTSPTPVGDSPSDFTTMSEDDTAHRRQHYLAENIACARETCKAVESISLSVFLGPLFLIYALRIALGVLTDEMEKQWILRKLTAIGKSFGIARVEIEQYNQQDVRS